MAPYREFLGLSPAAMENGRPPDSCDDESRATTRAQVAATRVLAAAMWLLGLYTLQGFLDALAWAAIFAIALWPLYTRTLDRLGNDRHNIRLPLTFTLAVGLIFIAPLGLVGVQFARESHAVADWLSRAQQNGVAEPGLLSHLPYGQAQVDSWWQQNLADPGSAKEFLQRATRGHVADVGRLVFAQVTRRLTLFAFTLLTLFFLFREGHRLTFKLRRAVARTFGAGGERMAVQIVDSVHGTVDGLVLVGLGVGVLLGIVYAIAGVPDPTVFGVLTAVAAMVPFAAPVIFSIAAALVMVKGSLLWAIIVFGSGVAVTFIADHVVRPTLIGGSTKLPFLWVLLGILGGLEVWGLIGLFFGPAIMAALSLLWREWVADPAPGTTGKA